MKTTRHHLPFLPNSKQQATETQKAFMLYSLLGNSGDAIKSEVSIHESNAVPQKLLECSLYKQATKSPKISSVIDAIRYNYASCDLSIAQFGSGDAYYLCRITMGAIRLSLTFDAETFIDITATQSLDIEQMREVVNKLILHNTELQVGFFYHKQYDKKHVGIKSPKYILDLLQPSKIETIIGICMVNYPSISPFDRYVVICFFDYERITYISARYYASDLPEIIPNIDLSEYPIRPPKTMIERLILS
jgi:hypothetical protein